MVLVDTSVWIRFLANRAPYARELEWFMENSSSATPVATRSFYIFRGQGGANTRVCCQEWPPYENPTLAV